MAFPALAPLLDWLLGRNLRSRSTRWRRSRPVLETLEGRSLPSTFTVTDLGDAGLGFGLQGDLRYAVNMANANGDLTNRIAFQATLTGTITLTQGPLDITKDLEIDGPGQDLLTVSGNQSSGVFNVTADPRVRNVRLADLTIADGTGIPGSVVRGGELYNDHAAVSLTRVTISGGVLPSSGQGGAIYNNSGALTLDSTTIADNQGAALARGGGVYNNTGTVTVTNSTFTGNRVGRNSNGGGIYNQAGTVTVSGSTIVENTAQGGAGIGGGGGFDIVDHSTVSDNMGDGIETLGAFVQLTDSTVADNVGVGIGSLYFQIERSTISGNFDSTGAGGGIVQNGCPGVGTVDNSTISDNTAFRGGGVDVGPTVGGQCPDSVTITHSTIVDNHAVLGAFGQGGGGGIFIQGDIANGFGSLFVGASIVAGNDSAIPFTGQDVDGPVTSLHANFIGNGDFSDGWVTTGRDMDHVGTSSDPLDPMLGPLQDNGGPTLTRAPLPGSPVLSVFAADQSPDQRGSFRVFGAPGAVAANPASALRVDAPMLVAPGQPFQITVTAVDQWGNTASTYQGTVHFSSTDLDAQLPDDYAFGAADGGAHSFDATLQTAGLQTILIQDINTASLATAVSLFVNEGFEGTPVGWDSHHLHLVL